MKNKRNMNTSYCITSNVYKQKNDKNFNLSEFYS